jgi:hypothetical protein
MSLKINDVYFVWCPLSSLYKPPHVYLLESIIIQKARAKRRAAAAAAAAARTSSSLREIQDKEEKHQERFQSWE